MSVFQLGEFTVKRLTFRQLH